MADKRWSDNKILEGLVGWTAVVDKEVTSTNSFIEGGYDSEGGDT